MSERDTHFLGSAQLLREKIAKARNEREIDTLIAHYAYDLIYHIRQQTAYGMDLLYIKEWIAEDVPDLPNDSARNAT